MKKKFITYIVMGMLAVCIAGCGNSEEKSKDTELKETVQKDNTVSDESTSEEIDNSEAKDNENEKESENLEELYFLSGDDKTNVGEWDNLISDGDNTIYYYYYGPIYGPKNDTGDRYKFFYTSFFVFDEYNEKFDGTLEEFFVKKIGEYTWRGKVFSDYGILEQYTGEYVEINGKEFYKFNGYVLWEEDKPTYKKYITGYVFDIEGYKGMMFSYINDVEYNEDENVRKQAQHNVDTAIKGFRYEYR